jgi:hypothetical protein
MKYIIQHRVGLQNPRTLLPPCVLRISYPWQLLWNDQLPESREGIIYIYVDKTKLLDDITVSHRPKDDGRQ